MNIIIEKTTFSEVLKKAQKSVPSKAPMEILKNIKLSAENDILYVESADGEMYVTQEIEADETLEIIEEGSICVPAKKLMSTVQLMADGTINLQLKGITLHIKGQKEGSNSKSHMKINGENSSDFPEADKGKSAQLVNISGSNLKKMIHKTVYATSNTESRPVLTGVLFSKKDNMMNVIATDSHRLSKYRIDLDDSQNDDVEYRSVIPSGVLNKISSYIQEESNFDVYQSEKNNTLFLYSDGISIQTRLIAGNYPDTDRIIPTDRKIAIRLNKDEFKQSLKRTSVMSDAENNKVIKFTLNDENTVTLDSNNESGESTEVLDTLERDGDPIELSFNVDYMLDALKGLESEDVNLYFNSSMQPIVIQEKDYTQLVLPVRTY